MMEQARRAQIALVHVLPRSVDIRDTGDSVVVNGTPLRIDWIGEGWLRDVRRVLAYGPDRPDIVAAHRMSPAAREALGTAAVGWVDETGAAEIAVGPIVVSRSGRPVERRLERWTPAVLAVAEALLCGTKATVASTAQATGLSAGSCTNALRFLADGGLLAADAERGRNSARRLADPDRLLDSYAGAVAGARHAPALHVGVTWRDAIAGLADIGARWDAAGCAWACSGAVAALVMAPYLTSVGTADVYVDADTIAGLEAVAADARLHPVDGGRLVLRPFPTTTSRLLRVEAQRLRVAPWPRVYADLRLIGVRGEEAAEHLRKVMHAG